MDKRVTLQEAFTAWCAQPASAGDLGTHLDFPALYALLMQPAAAGTQEAHLYHLTRCPQCLQDLKTMAASLRESQGRGASAWAEETATTTSEDYTDEARSWAAAANRESQGRGASALQWPKRIPTVGGHMIVIRRMLAEKHRGVITLEVGPTHRDRLEGKIVTVRDGREYILLRGEIVHGQVSQEVEDLNALDLNHFSVEPE